MRVTKNPSRVKDGKRPTTVYIGAQHAREWITPEMVRRLLDHVLDQLRHRSDDHELVNTTEMWFIPVANPDGYDFTFQDGQRLWRKNLRDNDGDGVITGATASTSTATIPTRWGYDNEGSSPNPASETYRGPRPAPSRRRRRSTPCSRGSRPSSSSTTTRPPSCCCTASAGRSPPRRRTTCSTRRWSATTPTRPFPATTPTSRPSSTRPTATPTRTCRRRTARSGSRPRWRPARRHPRPIRTTRGSRRTARASSTSPTTRH